MLFLSLPLLLCVWISEPLATKHLSDLAAKLAAKDRVAEAATTWIAAIAVEPSKSALHYGLGMAIERHVRHRTSGNDTILRHASLRDAAAAFAQAVHLAERVSRGGGDEGPARGAHECDVALPARFALGAAQQKLGFHAEASATYAKLLDTVSGHSNGVMADAVGHCLVRLALRHVWVVQPLLGPSPLLFEAEITVHAWKTLRTVVPRLRRLAAATAGETRDVEAAAIGRSLAHPSLQLLLSHSFVASVEHEMLLTDLRAALLNMLSVAEDGAHLLRRMPLTLLTGLAMQCFVSEFAWFESAEEQRVVRALIANIGVESNQANLFTAGIRHKNILCFADGASGVRVRDGASLSASFSEPTSQLMSLARLILREDCQAAHVVALLGSYRPLWKIPVLGTALAQVIHVARLAATPADAKADAKLKPLEHGRDLPSNYQHAALLSWYRLLNMTVAAPMLEHSLVEQGLDAIAGAIPVDLERWPALDADVTSRVRSQYEVHPYPRWEEALLPWASRTTPMSVASRALCDSASGSPARLADYAVRRSPMLDTVGGQAEAKCGVGAAFKYWYYEVGGSFNKPLEGLRVLVAGGGTGQQPIMLAGWLRGANITTIDISAASLAFGMRIGTELGIDNIRFALGDIEKIHSSGAGLFDHIECTGVLHHMRDPLHALKRLRSVLRPGGSMRIGLYDARADNVTKLPARRFARRWGFADSDDGIRAFRRAVMSGNTDASATSDIINADERKRERLAALSAMREWQDFFSISGTRDLVFHSHERAYTVAQVGKLIHDAGLRFRGFDIAQANLQKFKLRFPEHRSELQISNWELFEQQNPLVFSAMIIFWVN